MDFAKPVNPLAKIATPLLAEQQSRVPKCTAGLGGIVLFIIYFLFLFLMKLICELDKKMRLIGMKEYPIR